MNTVDPFFHAELLIQSLWTDPLPITGKYNCDINDISVVPFRHAGADTCFKV